MFKTILLALETYSKIHYLMFRNILLNLVLKNGHKPLFNNSKAFGGRVGCSILPEFLVRITWRAILQPCKSGCESLTF